MKKYRRPVTGLLIGAAITPLAIASVIPSAGAGHGTYWMAKVLFPYTMLLAGLNDDSITHPMLALGLIQFPIYGLALAMSSVKRTIGILLLVHVVFATLCFSGLLTNFS